MIFSFSNILIEGIDTKLTPNLPETESDFDILLSFWRDSLTPISHLTDNHQLFHCLFFFPYYSSFLMCPRCAFILLAHLSPLLLNNHFNENKKQETKYRNDFVLSLRQFKWTHWSGLDLDIVLRCALCIVLRFETNTIYLFIYH